MKYDIVPENPKYNISLPTLYGMTIFYSVIVMYLSLITFNHANLDHPFKDAWYFSAFICAFINMIILIVISHKSRIKEKEIAKERMLDEPQKELPLPIDLHTYPLARYMTYLVLTVLGFLAVKASFPGDRFPDVLVLYKFLLWYSTFIIGTTFFINGLIVGFMKKYQINKANLMSTSRNIISQLYLIIDLAAISLAGLLFYLAFVLNALGTQVFHDFGGLAVPFIGGPALLFACMFQLIFFVNYNKRRLLMGTVTFFLSLLGLSLLGGIERKLEILESCNSGIAQYGLTCDFLNTKQYKHSELQALEKEKVRKEFIARKDLFSKEDQIIIARAFGDYNKGLDLPWSDDNTLKTSMAYSVLDGVNYYDSVKKIKEVHQIQKSYDNLNAFIQKYSSIFSKKEIKKLSEFAYGFNMAENVNVNDLVMSLFYQRKADDYINEYNRLLEIYKSPNESEEGRKSIKIKLDEYEKN